MLFILLLFYQDAAWMVRFIYVMCFFELLRLLTLLIVMLSILVAAAMGIL